MKAKEYLQFISPEPTNAELAKVLQMFLQDAKDLIQYRHAMHLGAIASIFKEVDEKWRRFVTLAKVEGQDEAFRVAMLVSGGHIKGYSIFTQNKWDNFSEVQRLAEEAKKRDGMVHTTDPV